MDEIKEGYSISTDKSKLQLDVIHGFLCQSYWAKDISIEKVNTAIEHSLCFGVYHGDKQVGFARVVTDYAVIAYVGDVFIVEEERGKLEKERGVKNYSFRRDQTIRRGVTQLKEFGMKNEEIMAVFKQRLSDPSDVKKLLEEK